MIFGSDGGADEPSLIIDGVRIPFRMEAHVGHGQPEANPDDDWLDGDDAASWMIHLPIEMQVTLPHGVLHPPPSHPPAAPPPVLPAPGHTDPDPHPEPAAWRPGDVAPPHGGPDRDRPIGAGALESLGLGETAGGRVGGRSDGPPDLAGLVFPAARDAGGPGNVADDRPPPSLGTGGTTGHRALDAAFAAGRIETLHRILSSPAAPAAAADADAAG